MRDPEHSLASALAIGTAVLGLFAMVTGCADSRDGGGPSVSVVDQSRTRLVPIPTGRGRPEPAACADAMVQFKARCSVMSEEKVRKYDLYLAAWSDVPDEERARMLRESLSETIVFSNPIQTRHGLDEVIEHLEGFQKRSPGGSFRMNNMVGWADHSLAEWQLVDGKGNAGPSGYDVVRFDDRGLISTILLFGNVEAQKLAWRRRDPVALQPTD